MPSSQQWNDFFIRFDPRAVSREYDIPIDKIADHSIFLISKNRLNSEIDFIEGKGRYIYPVSSEQLNTFIRSMKYPAGEFFWLNNEKRNYIQSILGIRFPEIMAIINMTPDSFFPGSRFKDEDLPVLLEKYKKQRVRIVDIGGQSTRPGSERVDAEEEIRRIRFAVEESLNMGFIVSVDSFQVKVVKECLDLGAKIINDVTGMENQEMGELSRKYQAPIVIMHKKGDFKTMQLSPYYENVTEEIISFFAEKLEEANRLGISNNVILDPGIGFGKSVAHNLYIIRNIQDLKLGHPLLIGLSRKSFIGAITGESVEQREQSSLIFNSIALLHGADIIRVHDVEQSIKLIKIIRSINEI
ncbi:MAG: dihydropteroate synthase [Thermoplasmatales archaeon]